MPAPKDASLHARLEPQEGYMRGEILPLQEGPLRTGPKVSR